ncbi:hypothetical protein [Streptomyces sp. NBC_01236]|uniref:hypothetical protein n=1 Tax=Streptomyces sp. NBC_01236 TaxID=2903789 RepID=UPI002E0D22F7|nr:hypothetical protein OG324_23810 [Streptomyces sp. NBC_01236]
MSPTPHPPHPLRRCARARGGAPSRSGTSRSGTWLRILILLVTAVLATGPHLEALAASTPTAGTESGSGSGSGTAEHDVLDTALRPPTRQDHRPLTPLRPDTRTPEHQHGPLPVPAPASPSRCSAPHTIRCVVLRC